MAAVGLVGAVVGLVAFGIGIHLTFQATSQAEPGGLSVALLVVLIGGAVLGGVVIAGRTSRAAPIVAGGLLLLVAVSGTLFPHNMFSIDGVGMGAVTAGPLAVVVLLAAVAVRPSRSGPRASDPRGPVPYR